MILDLIIAVIFPSIVSDKPGFIVFPAIFLVLLPFFVFLQAKRNFKTNRRLSEQIEYSFTDDNLIITGESFNGTMTWDKIFKVTKTKRWILIWQSSNSANIIPLKDVWDGDINYLKEILDKRGVSNNIKY